MPWPNHDGPFALKEKPSLRRPSFVLRFHGSAAPVAGSSQTLQAQTTATDQTFRTALRADGIQATLAAPGGGQDGFCLTASRQDDYNTPV